MPGQSPAGPPREIPPAATHEARRDPAREWESTTPGSPSLGPELMLALWASWVEFASNLAGAHRTSGQLPWQMSPEQITRDLLQGGVRQLGDILAKNPILRATEDALNANPLRLVIPVNWAEIAR